MKTKTLITGFPRIGENRELKKALENCWNGKISPAELNITASELKRKHWLLQKEAGIDLISCNDFSLYDNMLDTIVMLNAIPQRFRNIQDETERYFAMARGTDKAPAMEMTKWFNTNYHYIVPELCRSMKFTLNASKIISEYKSATGLGITPKINIIGPLTFMGLSKCPDGGDSFEYYQQIISVYRHLIMELSILDGEVYLQIDEPVLVKDPDEKILLLLESAYRTLPIVRKNVKIIVTTYFEHSCEATAVLADTPVWGLGLDFVHGPENFNSLDKIKGKKLIAGVVDGRNIWINNFGESVNLLNRIKNYIPADDIIVSTSCSLLHVPFSVKKEPASQIKNWLSFASEKCHEAALISKIFRGDQLSTVEQKDVDMNNIYSFERKSSTIIHDKEIQIRVNQMKGRIREGEFTLRIKTQREILQLPPLPTTTIGSFPQTPELRKLRQEYKAWQISLQEYENGIKKYIDHCVSFQEEIGLDILVHGEPERNDMVEYFGEMLRGFIFTSNGWVQSYGSRCVKPPVIYGDIERPEPMTLHWIKYAQSRTEKIMKGMLTGPVTILNWSFVRDDIPRSEVSAQIAVALSDEIADLQSAGIKIIQVDEAAFKEGYPLRKKNIPAYEKWAVDNFRLAVHTAKMDTQIHTHMCYSEFNDIIGTIEAMDADVITIETARSGNDLLKAFSETGYRNEIGPGVYDIHSPRVPSVEELKKQIKALVEVLPPGQLWINPDCGLKTRKWEEVKPSLINMVEAVKQVRTTLNH